MKKYINHDTTSDGRTVARVYEAQQVLTMLEEKRALTSNLMEQVCNKANLNQAYKRVMKNKGAAGVDNMTVKQLFPWIKLHKDLSRRYDKGIKPNTDRVGELFSIYPTFSIKKFGWLDTS